MGLTLKSNMLPQDENRKPIQVANGIDLDDDSAVVKTSPTTLTTTAVATLTVPTGATKLWLFCAAAIFYGPGSALDGTAGNGRMALPANTLGEIPCANMSYVYVANQASATNALYFRFDTMA